MKIEEAKISFNQIKYFQLLLISGLLFISGLQIPQISALALFLIPCYIIASYLLGFPSLLSLPKSLIYRSPFLPTLALLVIFSFYYFITVDYYDLDPNQTPLIVSTSILIIHYLIGSCLDYRKLPFWPINYVIIFLFLIFGGIVFVTLSVNISFQSGDTIAIVTRKVTNFWNPGGEKLNGPSVDIFSILGTALLPLLIYGKQKIDRLTFWLLGSIVIVAFSLSLYASLVLQARTPIVCIIVSVVASTALVLAKSKSKVVLFAILAIGLLLVLFFQENIISSIGDLIGNAELLERFNNEGLDTPRYQLWKMVIEEIFNYPFGGRLIILPGSHDYAHNLWLDVAYDAGLIPMFILIVFHCLHFKSLVKTLNYNLPRIVSISIVCLCVGFLAGFIGTPVIQASRNYFAMSCLFLGSVLRLAIEGEIEQKQTNMSDRSL